MVVEKVAAFQKSTLVVVVAVQMMKNRICWDLLAEVEVERQDLAVEAFQKSTFVVVQMMKDRICWDHLTEVEVERHDLAALSHLVVDNPQS